MSRLRFSTRWVFICLTVVSVLLYLLYIRPAAVANRFARAIQDAGRVDLQKVSDRYFAGVNTKDVTIHSLIEPRSWSDVFSCRQRFAMALQPASANGTSVVIVHEFSASPLTVNDVRPPFPETRELRPAAKRGAEN